MRKRVAGKQTSTYVGAYTEELLDRDVVASRSDYYMLSHIARLVNEGFFAEGGRIRGVPVTIGGSSYVPPLPNELDVKDRIREIVEEDDEPINIAFKTS